MSSSPRGTGSFARGIHPRDAKELSAESPIEELAAPKSVTVPLLQHLGAAAKQVVALRQEVAAFELIAEAVGFVSASVHTPIAGKVGPVRHVTLPNGRHVDAVPIVRGEAHAVEGGLYESFFGGVWPMSELDSISPEDVVGAVRKAGLVGLGGAAFPTHVKLAQNPQKPVDTILINGCECEPYLTGDYRLMLEAPLGIVAGARLAARACGASAVVIAIEDNKPKAIAALAEAVSGTGVIVKTLRSKYPMGGEKQTLRAALGRTVPTSGLPLDVGVVVLNVGTALALARAVLRQQPLTHRVVTVSGEGVRTPKNLLVPIGVPLRALIDHCGGLADTAVRVVAGGPLMGFAVANLDAPVTKGTSGLTALTERDVARGRETSCLRCGRCSDVCPLNLVPTRLAMAARKGAWDVARRYHITACMECGCCAYVCPAGISLVQLIRVGKARLPKV